MSSFIVRFPDGNKQFRYIERELVVGDAVWHDGRRYRVLSVESEDGRLAAVTVEIDSDDLGDVIQSERGGILLEPVG